MTNLANFAGWLACSGVRGKRWSPARCSSSTSTILRQFASSAESQISISEGPNSQVEPTTSTRRKAYAWGSYCSLREGKCQRFG
jgi:hypothetical protein